MADQAHIRNFSIIAHIDHGKSTLADRILELTKTVEARGMRAQLLDSMELERERGITIKAQAVRVLFDSEDGQQYQLHLIDTPGHVDFTYEVSRSLAACEGALLVVDASQGVEAQTLANTYLAIEGGLELIPCLNKIDLPGAEPERVADEIAELLGEPADGVRRISAKTGDGVIEVLEELVRKVPPPQGDPDGPPRAVIFDSEFDQYRGVIAYIRVVDGTFTKGEAIRAMATGTQAEIDDIGFFTPNETPAKSLSAGEVGYVITGVKDVTQLRVGDTLTTKVRGAEEALPGYRDVQPMVYCGLFPIESDQFPELRDALEKLTLNDAALQWEPETSDALGFGFRCGFLGLLHMDIVRERLEREYDLDLMATMPSVGFEVTMSDGTELEVHNPSDFPDPTKVKEIREPFVKASVLAPKEYVGTIMELCQEKRGEHAGMHYLSADRVQLEYLLPLAEIVLDFFDQLKSRTKGYASLDYELVGLRPGQRAAGGVRRSADPGAGHGGAAPPPPGGGGAGGGEPDEVLPHPRGARPPAAAAGRAHRGRPSGRARQFGRRDRALAEPRRDLTADGADARHRQRSPSDWPGVRWAPAIPRAKTARTCVPRRHGSLRVGRGASTTCTRREGALLLLSGGTYSSLTWFPQPRPVQPRAPTSRRRSRTFPTLRRFA
ncbi:MAG: Translation elongation factor LepA [uncultured Sphingomonas sp.]|uniref:Elongation factor 4 n=1 Tax=uncultured Sphingomonas sp. TaxID=158754 RepID=A0A6J4SPT3_9SPHN|nr:translation elongation factor 4 [uncultured Sphingomonas sp.]CAA9501316.1 MAG: Translation elongation factor LepA [uncultured Sphingomonas sp.]